MFEVANPMEKAMQGMSQASNTSGGMMKDIPANRKPEPTVGGAAMSALGAGAAGAQTAALVSASAAAGPIGLAIGATIGLGSYLLS